jgi:hypothetical protein
MIRALTSLALVTVVAAACGDDTQSSASQTGSASASATNPTTATTDPSTGTPTTSTGTASATDSGGTDGGSATTGGTSNATTTATSDASSTTDATTSDTTGAITDTTTGTSTTTTGDSSGGDSTGGMEACGCPDIEVPLDDGIFVLSGDAELWKYFPANNTFKMLGSLNCGMTDTFSMAVDRLGFAWVQFLGGDIRKVDVTDVSKCTDPGFIAGQNGVENFGMAFVSNSESDACDRIYGNTYSGFGGFSEGPNIGDFITIDPMTLKLSKLGKTNFDGAEGTGTGDGRAFLFGGTGPAKLVEVDKKTGAAKQTLPLAGLEINNGAFAFAFFAGDFYFFTDSNNDFFASEVTRLDYDDSDGNGKQDLTQLTDNAPLVIVGAGVSTCAPVAPQ